MIPLLVILHLLGAAVWTGGHLVLALAVLPRAFRERDPGVVARFEAGYERLGIPALLVQVLTGIALAVHHAPAVESWLSLEDPLGALIAAKVLLLAATVGLALHARLRVLPDLAEERLRGLAWHVGPVTVLAVLMVVAGAGVRLVAAG